MLLFIISMVIGGSAWHDNDPRKDGDDGTSFISPDGEMYLEPLKGNTRFFSCVPNNALYTMHLYYVLYNLLYYLFTVTPSIHLHKFGV